MGHLEVTSPSNIFQRFFLIDLPLGPVTTVVLISSPIFNVVLVLGQMSLIVLVILVILVLVIFSHLFLLDKF